MSSWKQTAAAAIQAAHGPEARPRLYRVGTRYLAVAVKPDDEDGTDRVLALAGGDTADDAWRKLCGVVTRGEPGLETAEAAEALGLTVVGLNKMAGRDHITPARRGNYREPALYEPAELWRVLHEPWRRRVGDIVEENEG